MMSTLLWWGSFNLFIGICIYLDLKIVNRKGQYNLSQAAYWSLFWAFLAIAFGGYIYLYKQKTLGLEFITAYIIEKLLSIDNVFVFYVVFDRLKLSRHQQHLALTYGIIGAVIMRTFAIFSGIWLLNKLHFLIYPLGLTLIYIGFKTIQKKSDSHLEDGFVTAMLNKHGDIKEHTEKHKTKLFWFNKEKNRLALTTFGLAIFIIEGADFIFAIDSIPAILAITNDPFIAYTSNIFAILGLRALYFFFAIIVEKLTYLKYGVGIVVGFVGVKMLLKDVYDIPILFSLTLIILILGTAISASLFRKS